MGNKNIWLNLRDSVRAINDDWLQAYLFAHLGRIWPKAGESLYWDDALTALERVTDENDRTLLLSRLAPNLPVAHFERVMGVIEGVSWQRNRTRLLLAYAPYLPAANKAAVLAELQTTLLDQPYGDEMAEQLDKLIPLLSDSQRAGAVEMIQGQTGLWNQAQKLRPFLTYLPTKERQTIVSQIIFRCRRLETAEKFRVLAEVATYLPEPKIRELVDGFRELDDDTSRLAVLERLVEVLPEAQMAWIWDGIQSVWNKNRRSWLLCRLYYWLPSNRQPTALAEIRNTLQISNEQDKLLLSIRDYVPHVLMPDLMDYAGKMPDPPQMALLHGLVGRLPAGMLAEGLEVALAIGRPDLGRRRLEMLNLLAERLVIWAEEVPASAQISWQWLFSRRKGVVDLLGDLHGLETVSDAAVSRTEFLVDLMGLLPFFLYFVPDNHKPVVAVQLINEMRKLVEKQRRLMSGGEGAGEDGKTRVGTAVS